MRAELTMYRCYWPQAFGYLKAAGVKDYTAKAYGLLMTVQVALEHATALTAQLPFGVVVGLDQDDTLQPLELHEIDELLATRR